MFNLALALLFSWIVFLTGMKQTGNHVGCIVVAVLLHYFIMASFMWMLVEGILQYFLFVKVLGTYVRKFMLKATILAWGLPVLPVVIMLSIDVELYNGGETYCWMGLQGLYYGFALPLGLIILANIIIYIMVTRSICSRKNLNTTDLQHSVANTRASFCCFIYLGLTWVFGFLAISDARLAFQYIFTVLNSLQGFLIFILFTARDKKVRDYWKQRCCSYKTCRRRAPNPSNTTTSL
ncbi:adhesion G-protein coupled receptor G6-like [Patella vulgata]|uniref:adhesion G-protein coupled receptor G6-like n=1 Tax=Patella vulgata TaxID=6465 RepID=UPI0024A7FCE5|nr:adhesion G-protein coupled receptor G6-like [Patella vulgata]